jgi:hypothetical protein
MVCDLRSHAGGNDIGPLLASLAAAELARAAHDQYPVDEGLVEFRIESMIAATSAAARASFNDPATA